MGGLYPDCPDHSVYRIFKTTFCNRYDRRLCHGQYPLSADLRGPGKESSKVFPSAGLILYKYATKKLSADLSAGSFYCYTLSQKRGNRKFSFDYSATWIQLSFTYSMTRFFNAALFSSSSSKASFIASPSSYP